MKSSAFCLLIIVEILAILVCVFLWEKWNSNHEVNRIIVLDEVTTGTTKALFLNAENETQNPEISVNNRMEDFISNRSDVIANVTNITTTNDSVIEKSKGAEIVRESTENSIINSRIQFVIPRNLNGGYTTITTETIIESTKEEIKNEEISIDNRMKNFISSTQNVTTNDDDMISTEDKISGIEDNKTNTKFENEGKNAEISIDSRMQNLFTTTKDVFANVNDIITSTEKRIVDINDSKENAKIENENHNKEFDDFEGNGNVITTTEDVIETTESQNGSLSVQLKTEKVVEDLIPNTNDVITNAKEGIIDSENGIKNTNVETESISTGMYDTTNFVNVIANNKDVTTSTEHVIASAEDLITNTKK